MSTERLWTLVARKLAGECSADELIELSTLLTEHPDLHLQLQSIISAWESKNDSDEQDQDPAYQRHLDRLRQAGFELHASGDADPETTALMAELFRPKPKKRKWFFIALTATVIGLGAYLLIDRNHPVAPTPVVDTKNTISTKYGSRTKIELPDGSSAWLNAGSKLTYNKDFGTTVREVQLSGEGFFDVVHDSTKPFIIRTAYVDIKDLGTQFNVKSYPGDKTTEVSLVKGSVEITMKKRPNDKWVLKPNEKISVANAVLDVIATAKEEIRAKKPALPILTLDKVNFDKYGEIREVAWTKNQLAFVNESIDQMALKLERWFGKKVIVENSNLNALQFTATFETESIEQVLKALQLSSGKKINFTIDTEKVTIY